MHVQQGFHQTASQHNLAGATPEHEKADADDSLEDAARDEREYARSRLSEELKREPTEDEINDWLRQQTEGY
jgi:DNA-directed RNA polymerase specialized sigma subunit